MSFKRNKTTTIRVNEDLYNQFLKTVEKFTSTYTNYFPSRNEKKYITKFPDKPYANYEKYTLADLVEESMREFIKKYNSNV